MINAAQINWRKLLPERMWQKNWDKKNGMFYDRKYKQQIQKRISNCLQYKLTFFVALNKCFFRPLSTLYTETAAKSRLIAAKALPSSTILEKVWLSLTAPAYLAFLEFGFEVWTSFSFAFAFVSQVGTRLDRYSWKRGLSWHNFF